MLLSDRLPDQQQVCTVSQAAGMYCLTGSRYVLPDQQQVCMV
jgi:hypothetical protein